VVTGATRRCARGAASAERPRRRQAALTKASCEQSLPAAPRPGFLLAVGGPGACESVSGVSQAGQTGRHSRRRGATGCRPEAHVISTSHPTPARCAAPSASPLHACRTQDAPGGVRTAALALAGPLLRRKKAEVSTALLPAHRHRHDHGAPPSRTCWAVMPSSPSSDGS
jgi:hypothetical protein